MFPIVYQFCNGDINKFVLLLRKGVYPCQYMDSWERFDEKSLLDKEALHNELNLEEITDKDYALGQKVWEVFEIKNLGEYHDLCVQGDTLLLANEFENFQNKYIEIYKLDPAHFLSAPRLAWPGIDMLLMVEKGIRGRMCQVIQRCAKANNKYMKSHDKNIISSYLISLDASNLYGWAMSQKLPVNGFKWLADSSQFKEDFIKNCDGNSDIGYFFEVDVEYQKNLFSGAAPNLHKDLKM